MTTENVTIEKGIAIPPPNRKRRGMWSDAFQKMDVGDSLLMSHLKRTSEAMPRYYYVTKITGRKFTARKVDGGVRVWRIA